MVNDLINVVEIQKKFEKNILQSKVIFHTNYTFIYFIFKKTTPFQKEKINKILNNTNFFWGWVSPLNLIIINEKGGKNVNNN